MIFRGAKIQHLNRLVKGVKLLQELENVALK